MSLQVLIFTEMLFMARFLSNPSPTEFPSSADVIVIGGGPAGAAALWALESAAPGTKTVLIERNSQLAATSSAASLENYRTCWPTPCLARLMQRSIEVFHQADEFLGEGASQAISLKQQGYIYCSMTDKQADKLKRDVVHLHSIGLTHVEYLDANEIAYRFPWLGGRVVGAKYDPVAGWLDSYALTYKLAQSSPSATILLDVSDAQILVESGRITGVNTPNGSISAPKVILAAGPDSRRIGRTVGIELPIIMRPRQSFTTHWRHEGFPAHSPCIIGAPPGPHVRPEAQSGAIFGWEYGWNNKHIKADDEPTQDYLIDPIWPVSKCKDMRFPPMVLMLMAKQFGHQTGEGFGDDRYLRGLDHRAGYYVYRDGSVAYQVDANSRKQPYDSQRAIIDNWPELEGLTISVAHVGHGIMSAPAGGEIAASKALGLPLPDSLFADFGLDAHWVEHDAGGLSEG
jgi:glycine/D-amino acid oxidase-like deaminating enzyme